MVEAETFAEKLTKKMSGADQAVQTEQTGLAIKIYEEIIKEEFPSPDDLTEDAIRAKE